MTDEGRPQSEKFKRAARMLEADEGAKRWEERLGTVAKEGGEGMGEIEDRIAELNRKLAAREGQPGYTQNVIALKTEIVRLQGHDLEQPDRLTDLKRKLAAREGQPGYHENVEALKAEIARLEAEESE